MSHRTRLRIGTRGSSLARWQAGWVASQLRETAGVDVELVEIRTIGDRTQSRGAAIGSIAVQGAFTKEIQRALLDGRVDLAVHSLKDLPTDLVEGLCLAAIPRRAAASDVFVSRAAASISDLAQSASVGTGSLRRRTQLWHVRPDLRMSEARGNVETRLRRLAEGKFDALILAEAGLRRLGLDKQISEVLPHSLMLPAVGQGALGIEARSDDDATRRMLAPLDDPPTRAAVTAEREMLATLRGGCLAPVAGYGRIDARQQLLVQGIVLSLDGKTRLEASASGSVDQAASLGRQAASALLDQGAGDLIRDAREMKPD